jgi:predicted neutral ceramidase superfamily lipid hydrolase
MSTLTKEFAGVQWLWILEWSAILAGLNLFAHRLRKTKPSVRADFAISLLLGAAWLVFLILSHASPGAVEVAFAFCFAYAIESVVDIILNSRGSSKYNTENP